MVGAFKFGKTSEEAGLSVFCETRDNPKNGHWTP